MALSGAKVDSVSVDVVSTTSTGRGYGGEKECKKRGYPGVETTRMVENSKPTGADGLPQGRRVILRHSHDRLRGAIPQEVSLLDAVDEGVVQSATVGVETHELVRRKGRVVHDKLPRQLSPLASVP